MMRGIDLFPEEKNLGKKRKNNDYNNNYIYNLFGQKRIINFEHLLI